MRQRQAHVPREILPGLVTGSARPPAEPERSCSPRPSNAIEVESMVPIVVFQVTLHPETGSLVRAPY
jgi:hypothetical protein